MLKHGNNSSSSSSCLRQLLMAARCQDATRLQEEEEKEESFSLFVVRLTPTPRPSFGHMQVPACLRALSESRIAIITAHPQAPSQANSASPYHPASPLGSQGGHRGLAPLLLHCGGGRCLRPTHRARHPLLRSRRGQQQRHQGVALGAQVVVHGRRTVSVVEAVAVCRV